MAKKFFSKLIFKTSTKLSSVTSYYWIGENINLNEIHSVEMQVFSSINIVICIFLHKKRLKFDVIKLAWMYTLSSEGICYDKDNST